MNTSKKVIYQNEFLCRLVLVCVLPIARDIHYHDTINYHHAYLKGDFTFTGDRHEFLCSLLLNWVLPIAS